MEDLSNNFGAANAWQRSKRDAILKPFYAQDSVEGRFVFLDKGWFATLVQKRDSVDTVMQGENGRAVAIEEKLVQWPGYHYTAYCLETHSCTVPGRESSGWMRYGNADFLAYGFEQQDGSFDLHCIAFGDLQKWFWERVEDFKDFGPLDTLNRSKGKKVPIRRVEDAGLLRWRKTLPARAPA